MLSMAVQADKLCISAHEAGVDDGEAMADSQVQFTHHITHASHLPFEACWSTRAVPDLCRHLCMCFPCSQHTTSVLPRMDCGHTAASLCLPCLLIILHHLWQPCQQKAHERIGGDAGQIDGTDVRRPCSRPAACILQTPAGRCICRGLHCVN